MRDVDIDRGTDVRQYASICCVRIATLPAVDQLACRQNILPPRNGRRLAVARQRHIAGSQQPLAQRGGAIAHLCHNGSWGGNSSHVSASSIASTLKTPTAVVGRGGGCTTRQLG